jgi:DNA-binding MarR family transcriptional regulator
VHFPGIIAKILSDMNPKADVTNTHPEKAAATRVAGSSNSRALRRLLLAAEDLRLRMGHDMGLSRIETVAVEHLMGEDLGPVELSRRLHISSAAATLLVDRLQEDRHVTREMDATDRRRRQVRLRPATRRNTRAHVDQVVDAIVRVERNFTKGEREVIRRYLLGVADQLNSLAQPAPVEE